MAISRAAQPVHRLGAGQWPVAADLADLAELMTEDETWGRQVADDRAGTVVRTAAEQVAGAGPAAARAQAASLAVFHHQMPDAAPGEGHEVWKPHDHPPGRACSHVNMFPACPTNPNAIRTLPNSYAKAMLETGSRSPLHVLSYRQLWEDIIWVILIV